MSLLQERKSMRQTNYSGRAMNVSDALVIGSEGVA